VDEDPRALDVAQELHAEPGAEVRPFDEARISATMKLSS